MRRGRGNRGRGNLGRGNLGRGNQEQRNPRIDVILNKDDFIKVLININQINGANNIFNPLIDGIYTYGRQTYGFETYIAPTTNIRFIKNNDNTKILRIHYNQYQYQYRIDGFCKIIEILDTYFSNNVVIKIEIHNTDKIGPTDLDLEPTNCTSDCLKMINLDFIDIDKEINNLNIERQDNNTIRNININENNIYKYNTFLERLLFLIYLKINRNYIIPENVNVNVNL